MKPKLFYRETLTKSPHPDDPETLSEMALFLPDFGLWIVDDGCKNPDYQCYKYYSDLLDSEDECFIYLGEL
jgi:hypothetical protein